MRRIRVVFSDDPAPRETPVMVGPLLIRLVPEEIHVLPLSDDRAQAANCDARLQGLIRAWAEQPELLAELCETPCQGEGSKRPSQAPEERRSAG